MIARVSVEAMVIFDVKFDRGLKEEEILELAKKKLEDAMDTNAGFRLKTLDPHGRCYPAYPPAEDEIAIEDITE